MDIGMSHLDTLTRLPTSLSQPLRRHRYYISSSCRSRSGRPSLPLTSALAILNLVLACHSDGTAAFSSASVAAIIAIAIIMSLLCRYHPCLAGFKAFPTIVILPLY